jgi:hypothetical protein
MDYFGWNPYVRVAARRQQAAHRLSKLRKKGTCPNRGPEDRGHFLGKGLV